MADNGVILLLTEVSENSVVKVKTEQGDFDFKLADITYGKFVEKLNDVVGLYLNPPERALVLCTDERSQIQALDRSQPAFPMLPGTPERRTWDYLRHGTPAGWSPPEGTR